MAKSVSKAFPKVKFYDQDLVDLYNKTWILIKECWKNGTSSNGLATKYFNYSTNKEIFQFESILSTFFLVYSNKIYPVTPILDNFYSKQEPSGAIRCAYSEDTGKPVKQSKNPEMVHPPLFAWAEYNIYHKLGLKSRVKEIVPILEKYFFWLEKTFKKDNGLYAVPLNATTMENSPRSDAFYPIDFNCQQAINALYMSALGEIMNDKERSYRFKKFYFSLKTRINKFMWNEEDGYYYDLDKKERQVKSKTIASFWPLLAELANRDKAEKMINALLDDQEFYTENPFPSVSLKHKHFHKLGMGFRGSVYPHLTFIIIKGLEKYGRFDLAREFAIKHLYSLVECLQSETEEGAFWEAYAPTAPSAAKWPRRDPFPRKNFLTTMLQRKSWNLLRRSWK